MARLWSSGFELNSTAASVEWTSSSGTISLSTTTVRSGTYALRNNPTAGQGSMVYDYLASGGGTDNLFYRFYLRITTATDGLTTIFATRDVLAAVNVAGIRLNLNRTLELWDLGNSTQIGSDSSALALDTWYRIELKYEYHATTPTLTAYIDGTSFATGLMVDQANNNPNRMTLGSQTNTTCDIFFDDVAVNDSTGSFQNGLPGEGEIIHLRPNAAGDNAQWSTGTGTTFAEVDEVTPDDVTTYIGSTTLNNISDFNLDATPAALASDDTINVVAAGWRIADAAAPDHGYTLRVKASSGGTVEESAEILGPNTTYITNKAAVPRNHHLTLYDLPGASTTAWTKADLDTAQIGVKLSTDSSGTVGATVSTLWLMVDHKPVAAGGSTLSVNVSDSISVTESTTVLIPTLHVSVSDSIAVTESLVARELSFVNVLDSVSVAESTNATLVINTSVSDSIAVAESLVVFQPFFAATLSDSISVTESTTVFIPFFAVTTSDSIGVTESVSVTIVDTGLSVSVSDSISTSESLSARLFAYVNVSESVTASESVLLAITPLFLSTSDSIVISEVTSLSGLADTSPTDTTTLNSLNQVITLNTANNTISINTANTVITLNVSVPILTANSANSIISLEATNDEMTLNG